MKPLVALTCLVVFAPMAASAAGIFAPGDAVIGVQRSGSSILEGVAGTAAGVNNWPAGEPPSAIVDGAGQKYLNFGKLNTGVIVTPAGGATVAGAFQLWTANDAVERDPASFEIFGTNAAISGSMDISSFTPVASGSLSLPASRNAGGAAALDVANSQTISFSNTAAYTSYLVLFPTVKNPDTANSMQVAEIQLHSVPEPGSLAVSLLGFAGLVLRRRR